MNESETVCVPLDGQKNVQAGREAMNAREWYESHFRQMLAEWFLILMDTSGSPEGYDYIVELEDNPDRKPMRQTAEEQSLFAAATCLMVLVTQVVWKLVGLEAAVECCRQKKWPVMRVGTGNQMHPLEMMAKAKLIPEERAPERYRTLYLSKIDELRPIMVSDLAVVDDAVNRELDEQIRRIRVYFKPRIYPPVFPHKIVKVEVEPKEVVRQEKQKPAQTIDDEKRKAREAAEREAKEAAEREAKEAAEREAAEREAEDRDSVWDPLDWRKNVLAGRKPFNHGGEVIEDGGLAYVRTSLGPVGVVIRDPSEWIEIPDWFTTADFGFLTGSNIEAVTIPGCWERDVYLQNCRKLVNVEFVGHDCSVRLGEGAFAGCSSLKHLSLPYCVQMPYGGVFRNCTSLEEIDMREMGVVDLDDAALPDATFVNCKSLVSVLLPEWINEIEDACFWNCRVLRTIQLPDSVEKIGRHVFGCDNPDPDSGLTAFNIPKGLMEIDPHAFGPGALNFENFTCSEGNGVFKVVDGILYERDDEGGGETLIRCPQGRTGEIVIPKGVKFVEDGAFAYCNKLTKITFLDEEIDPGPESAYEGCSDKLEKNW